jgi:CBS-domain-containing membrane protein
MQKSVQHRVVRDVMTRAPMTVGSKTDIRTLKTMFETYQFNIFPVVDEHQILLGVVTKYDFLRMFRPDRRRWIPDLGALGAKRVEDIMTRGVATVSPDDPIATVVDEIVRSRLRSLPVVERRAGKGVLVGIVSRHDVLRCLTLAEDGSND